MSVRDVCGICVVMMDGAVIVVHKGVFHGWNESPWILITYLEYVFFWHLSQVNQVYSN